MRSTMSFGLTFMASVLSFCMLAQDIIPIYQGPYTATKVVDLKGNVIFTLPHGHGPKKVGAPLFGFTDFTALEKTLDYFQDGMMVVRHGEGPDYIIDKNGRKVVSWGSAFSGCSAISDGVILASNNFIGKVDRTEYFYVDTRGEELFPNTRYWNASEFSEGLASIQKEENGPWFYINKKGEETLDLGELGFTDAVRAGSFVHGLAFIYFPIPGQKYGSHAVLINKHGEIILDLRNPINGVDRFVCRPLTEDRIVVLGGPNGPSAKFFHVYDAKGNLLAEIENPHRIDRFNDGKLFFSKKEKDNSGLDKINFYSMDRAGEVKPFSIKGMDFRNIRHRGIYYEIYTSVPKKNGYGNRAQYSLYDPQSKQVKYQTVNEIRGYTKDVILLEHPAHDDRIQLFSMDGKLLGESPFVDQLLTNIEEAVKNKNTLSKYWVNDVEDYKNGLEQLKNLELINLNVYPTSGIPAYISTFKKLEVLQFSNAHEIKSIPKSLANLPKVIYFYLESAPKDIQGLEYFIENAPALKTVILKPNVLSQTFIEKLKKVKPELELNYKSIKDFGEPVLIDEMPILEETPIQNSSGKQRFSLMGPVIFGLAVLILFFMARRFGR